MGKLTIYPDDELEDKLKEIAEEDNRNLNNLIITILKRHVKNRGK